MDSASLPALKTDADLKLKVENRKKNVFVTQLEEHRYRCLYTSLCFCYCNQVIKLIHYSALSVNVVFDREQKDEHIKHIPVITQVCIRATDTDTAYYIHTFTRGIPLL